MAANELATRLESLHLAHSHLQNDKASSSPIYHQQSYVYEPLDQSNSSIRLLRLHPSSHFDTEISCDIFNVSLDTKPKYECITYTWGDAAITYRIILQGHPFQATTNLVLALRYLRLKDQIRTLWVDAICIDQSNIPEREEQVAFMKNIYSMAQCDLLWLGEDPYNHAESAFEVISSIADAYNHALSKDSEEAMKSLDHLPVFEDAQKFSRYSRVLLDPPVWQRIWIVQEIAASQHVYLHFGHRSISWDVVESFATAVDTIQAATRARWKADVSLQITRSLTRARRHFKKQQMLRPILDIWLDFQAFLATDPRDMIFALMGLTDEESGAIHADYTKSPEEVFTDIVRSIISSTGELECLCLGHLRGMDSNSKLSLPSWVMDFSDGNDIPYTIYKQTGKHEASGSTSCLLGPPPNSTSLALHGLLLDAITSEFELYDTAGKDYRLDQVTTLILKAPEWIFESVEKEDGEERPIDAFARTLIANLITYELGELHPPAMDMINDFGDILLLIHAHMTDISSPIPSREMFEGWDLDIVEALDLFLNSTRYLRRGYKFCIFGKDGMALVPDEAKVGDQLVVLYGSKVPHVLREVVGEGTYELIGTAYVDEFMDGQAIEMRDLGDLSESEFLLI